MAWVIIIVTVGGVVVVLAVAVVVVVVVQNTESLHRILKRLFESSETKDKN